MADDLPFSLKDEDCNEMFITQEPSEGKNLANESEENCMEEDYGVLGVHPMDFGNPLLSVINGMRSVYEDISDEDVFENSAVNKPVFE